MNELVPPDNETRGDIKKKKFDFAKKKENTLHSLCEVEHFLCQLNKAFKCVKVYKILR